MLEMYDGRSELWQWDTGRTLAVDADCSQVHFSNKIFGRSIDVDVVDGVAGIPDILLQSDNDLNVWAFVGTAENGYTKISKTFKVNRRNKPADYVFTPPEQTSLEEIKEKIDYLESIQDPDAIKNAVDDYLEKNPVEAPVQSVNGQTGAVELTAEDVGAIAVETDPTVPAWAKQPQKPTYTANEIGAVSQDDLQSATDAALAQAKASGEFDGPQGPEGPQGPKGDTGEVGPAGPKGDTGATGAIGPQGPKGDKGDTGPKGDTGTAGADGKDGTSATHSWNGTVLTITSASGTSSSDLKGDKGDKGNTGPAGKDGTPGADGKTPEYGVDYGTPEQIAEIAQHAAGILQPDVNQIKNDLANIQSTIAEKMDSYTIKTVMDSVATPHTQYYLGNQTTVDIVLPDSSNAGQIITVCWYNGDTAATLSITGTMLDFDFTPSANTRSEINALWDGTYWAVLGNEMAVPSEVTA